VNKVEYDDPECAQEIRLQAKPEPAPGLFF
jgi:hypothetical protein